ncbi:MAG: TIGR01777 family oxidoreductase [Bacteroidales bacterium]
MKIAVSGITGFVGTHLKAFLEGMGNKVIGLSRGDFASDSTEALEEKLKGCNAVINLAGSPISGRWTHRKKDAILNSRIRTTRLLVTAVNRMAYPPDLFISASAIGIYPQEGCHMEDSEMVAEGFLAEVCMRWEAEAKKINPDIRLAILRFGLILGADGGIFPRIIKPTRFGVSMRFGNGMQPFSWIHIDDLLEIIALILYDPKLSGIFNCVAPDTLTWEDLMSEIDMHYETFGRLHIPEWLLKLFFLEGYTVLTHGQQVLPGRLMKEKFPYRYPELKNAVADLALKYDKKKNRQ